ncbi:uncharacterized protein V6R79_011809 [Siganus canaliculatus]
MSCFYMISEKSMACEWSEESNSHTELDVSLIFRSQDTILSCMGIFNPAATLNITARIKNHRKRINNWSLPHTVFLYDAIKPSQPVLTVLSSSADAVVVSWRSSGVSDCQLRYRDIHTHTWTQAPDFVPAHQDQPLKFTIQDLLPFTVYKVAVACRGESSIWSAWSFDVTGKTLDRVPSRSPDVCYRVEQTNSSRTLLLHLFWKDTDLSAAGGHVTGYQVSYEPATKLPLILNYTGRTALLEVEKGNYTVTVRAFNTAGYGPAARVSFDTQRHNTLPSVRHLWLSSSSPAWKSLQVQWEHPTASHSLPPISHFGVQWHPETHVSTSRWTTTDSFTTSVVIEDIDPHGSYLISVFPVYKQQCGSSQSLPASLQHGALMEVVKLWVVSVTKTTVTLAWTWRRKSESIRVDTYKLQIRKDVERQTLSLWPDQWQHTFHNLEANTEYSAHLLADDVSIVITPVRTEFDEVPAVAAVTPLLMLALFIFIVSILSRTLYKSYFFPPISSPQGSTAGQWLMDPNPKKTTARTVLDLEDFQVTDILGEKSPIMISPKSQPTTEEEDLLGDDSLVSMSHLLIQMSGLQVDLQYISHVSIIPEQQLDSLPSPHPDRAFKSEESSGVNSYFPQKD